MMLFITFSTVRKALPCVLSVRRRIGFQPPFLHPGPYIRRSSKAYLLRLCILGRVCPRLAVPVWNVRPSLLDMTTHRIAHPVEDALCNDSGVPVDRLFLRVFEADPVEIRVHPSIPHLESITNLVIYSQKHQKRYWCSRDRS